MREATPEAEVLISVVLATHNRPDQLEATLLSLENQDLPRSQYQIVVVDDGSSPPASVEAFPRILLLRLEGVERCVARNSGARAAVGRWVLFVDDDMRLPRHFLRAHLEAHREWPRSMVIGAVHLPPAWKDTPFGLYRSGLDQGDWPQDSGPTRRADFCTAQNMSLEREQFLEMGGFDAGLVASEDQDLGIRWLARGGQVAFCGQAEAEHHDSARDIRTYCRRMEWGSRSQVWFAAKHPDLPSSRKRHAVNGPVRWGKEAPKRSLQKLIKALLGTPLVQGWLFVAATRLEASGGSSRLERLYNLLLGIHLQRGWRAGLAEVERAKTAGAG